MPDSFRYDDAFYEGASDAEAGGPALDESEFAVLDEKARWPLTDLGRPDPSKPPSFKGLRDAGVAILRRTRDARAFGAIMLGEAGLNGAVGLARSLDLFSDWIGDRWDAFHPLDLDGDGEFFDRMEIMPTQFPVDKLRIAIEQAPLLKVPGLGDVSLRAFRIAAEQVTPREGEMNIPLESLRQAVTQTPGGEEAVAAAKAALLHADDRLQAIRVKIGELPDLFNGPEMLSGVLQRLPETVTDLHGALAAVVEEDASGDALPGAEEDGPSGAEDGLADGSAVAATAGRSDPTPGPQTRAEALAMLRTIVRHYARNARSSPVPVALIGLLDLMKADFNVWVKSTTPKGLEKAGLDLSEMDVERLDSFLDPEDRPPPPPPVDLRGLERAAKRFGESLAKLKKEGILEDRMEEMIASNVEKLEEAIDELREPEPATEEDGTGGGDGAADAPLDRATVKTMLEQVARFFERDEPSSPAPVYLRQAKRLVDAKFDEIMKIVSPEGDDPRLPFNA